jgi:hypothetical protein
MRHLVTLAIVAVLGIGAPLPSSITPHAMPNSVTQQVSEARNYEFVKLPDRVLMVDPTDQSIAEVIPIPAAPTTGGDAGVGEDRR